MIQEHIHKLLFEHDCVIIPDFGGLITHYEPARIHPVRHVFLPPSKRVAFNEKLKLNDGLLISTFAYDRKITPEEAQQQVSAFVRQLQDELQVSQRCELRGIGLFRLSAEQKIEFEYIASSNFLSDSFGLPELITRPIISGDAAAGLRTLIKEQQAERAAVTASKPSLRRKLRKIYDTAAVIAIGGLTCSALYFISLQTDYNLSSLNPFSLVQARKAEKIVKPLESPQLPVGKEMALQALITAPMPDASLAGAETFVEASPALAAVESSAEKSLDKPVAAEGAVSREASKPAVLKKTVKEASHANLKTTVGASETVAPAAKKSMVLTISEATHRYYIIAGGYSSLKNARWSLRQLGLQDGTGKVILPVKAGQLHRVSVQDYASKEEALEQLPILKKKYGNNIWILNY